MHVNSQRSDYPLPLSGRLLLFGWGVFLISGFGLAYSLEPDPRGYGTHQRLGLPPCTFQQFFHLPCPSCGMTTSISQFTRGNFAKAARANFGGFLLALFCAIQLPWIWVSIVRGRLWHVTHPETTVIVVLAILGGATLLQWGVRLLLIL